MTGSDLLFENAKYNKCTSHCFNNIFKICYVAKCYILLIEIWVLKHCCPTLFISWYHSLISNCIFCLMSKKLRSHFGDWAQWLMQSYCKVYASCCEAHANALMILCCTHKWSSLWMHFDDYVLLLIKAMWANEMLFDKVIYTSRDKIWLNKMILWMSTNGYHMQIFLFCESNNNLK